MYKETIKTLEELARSHQQQSKEIGFAIGLVRFCMQNKLSIRDNAFELPETSNAFGYYTVQECSEVGNPVKTISDENQNPLEFLSHTLLVDRKFINE